MRFCKRKTAEDNDAKISVSLNITCAFVPFKASAFLQVFLLRNLKNIKRTHIP